MVVQAAETARVVGVEPPPKRASGITDLLSETHTRLPLLSYLKTVYPKDWMNFLERMHDKFQVKIEDPNAVTGDQFLEGEKYHQLQIELLLWASNRGQLLARTVRIKGPGFCEFVLQFPVNCSQLFSLHTHGNEGQQQNRPSHCSDPNCQYWGTTLEQLQGCQHHSVQQDPMQTELALEDTFNLVIL